MNPAQLQQELDKARHHLEILYEISNAMRTTLKLDEILYVILTAVTAHAGLGFNRAMLFLINEQNRQLDGAMGVGPASGEEARDIWTSLDASRTTLDDLIRAYWTFRHHPSTLDNLVRSIHIPLSEQAGVLVWAALEGMPFDITTKQARDQLRDPVLDQLQLDRFVVVPLKARDRIVGVIAADNRFTGKPISKDEVRLLTLCANQAGLAIENSRLYEQTLRASRTDSLTQLWNHGTFQQLLAEELERSRRYEKPLTLAILDLDHFKAYNDGKGHQAGDQLLTKVARIIQDVARGVDHAARYGGEEFAIIFPETTKQDAAVACERIRTRVAGETSHDGLDGVTISIGLASSPQDATTQDELIYRADMALMAAKRAGRNQIRLVPA